MPERQALDWIEDELQTLDERHLRRRLVCRESPPVGGQIQIEGRPFVNFSSNDYLGLAADPRVAAAVRYQADKLGWGTGASGLVTGHAVLHRRLQHQIATFESTQAALLFSSGYAANVGCISALAGPPDVIFSDQMNHASIIDGCRLSRATVAVYRHADVDDLRNQMAKFPDARRRLIVTDSIFSMDGDFAPLNSLADIADEFGAMLMVDEAHATGVWGERGRGLCEAVGCKERVDVLIGTLSKGLGSIGGFAAGSNSLIDWLLNRARSYIFSTAYPEVIAEAGLTALEIVDKEPERRDSLLKKSRWLREQLVADGWNLGDSQSQIIPIYLGEPDLAIEYANRLRENGVWVPAIRPPAVAAGDSLLRISLSYSHSDSQLEQLVEALSKLKRS